MTAVLGAGKRLAERLAPESYNRARDAVNVKRWQLQSRRAGAGAGRRTATDASRELVQSLLRDGIVTADASMALDPVLVEEAGAAARELHRRAQQDQYGVVEEGKEFKVHLLGDFDVDSPFFKLALSPTLLAIAEAYLGVAPLLRAVDVWWDRPTDSPATETQLWHRDFDDVRMLKAFLYLTDVEPDTGPFCYSPTTHVGGTKAGRMRATFGKQRRLTDDDMARVVPRADWRICTGPAGSLVLADTSGYHKGLKPTNGDRLLFLAEYTSKLTRVRQNFDRDRLDLSDPAVADVVTPLPNG